MPTAKRSGPGAEASSEADRPTSGRRSLAVDRTRKTLRELTLEKMRTAIVDQYFQPGQRLVERNLCDELGVSRTVVREVLRHLETEGLVQLVREVGPVVASIDADTARQVYEMRALLEGHGAAACAERAGPAAGAQLEAIVLLIEAAFKRQDLAAVLHQTNEFYREMFHAAGETLAWTMVNSLNARINRLRAITIATRARGEHAPAEMRRLVDAIKRRDAAAAREAAEQHIRSVQSLALAALARDKAAVTPLRRTA